LTEKCLDTFWAIFSQTHLVTLAQTWQAETSSNSEGIKLLCFWRKLLGWLEICGGLLHRNPRSYARRSMFEKRRLFSGDCEGNRGFVDPWKMFLWSKLPCLGWISVQFYKVLFPPQKNICRTCANICTWSSSKISMGYSQPQIRLNLLDQQPRLYIQTCCKTEILIVVWPYTYMVTRLGQFSPNVVAHSANCLLWAVLRQLQKYLVPFFNGKGYTLILTKMGWATLWAIF
jgi:hypothetical protein